MKNPLSLLALNFFTLLLLLFFSSLVPANAQTVTDEKPFEINYYDKDWKLVTDRKKAQYYRHVFRTSDAEKVLVKDFYMSGQLQYECFATDYDSRDANKLAHDGTCRWYEADGRLSKEAEYRAGKQEGLGKSWDSDRTLRVGYFVDDYEEGPFNVFKPNGQLGARINYSGGFIEKFNIFCPEDGCLNIYLENFSNSALVLGRDWRLDTSTSFLESDGVLIGLSKEESFYQTNLLGVENKGVWTLSLDFQFVKPKGRAEHGIFFGANGYGNLISFTVGTDGTFSISERRNGVERAVVDRKKTTTLNKVGTTNELTVIRKDDVFEFRINNQVVHRQESLRWHGGDAGIISLEGQGQVAVWNFVYAIPVEMPTDLELKPPAWWNGTGSGFILSTDGFIVTNHHVIEDTQRVVVDVRKGEGWESVEAEVVAFDSASDLAILKIDPKTMAHISSIPYSINADLANLGTKVFTLGFPETDVLGSELKFTEGSVSSRSGFKGDVTTYQISVPLHPGNSGGPLFNEEGNLIGVVNSGVLSMQNVSYGVKASYLIDMIKSMDNGPKIPTENSLESMSQTERIKALSELMVFIKVKN